MDWNLEFRNCDFCVTDERCGFCTRQGEETRLGYCLPVDQTDKEDKSTTGYCSRPLGSEASLRRWAQNSIDPRKRSSLTRF
jgi:hypothetical protein